MSHLTSLSQARADALRLLSGLLDGEAGRKLKTKFDNLSGKTGQYGVPTELFQMRTARKGRALISWSAVAKNKLTLQHLNTFEGGVVVEFVNLDYFQQNSGDPLFHELKSRLGSDDRVASMISIRSVDGTSDSRKPREAFELLKKRFPNWKSQIIRRKAGISGDVNRGNDKIEGFIFVRIAGGQQDTLFSHTSNQYLFNPACEYASSRVSSELDLVMLYFALHSFNSTELKKSEKLEIENEIKVLAALLRYCEYEEGHLLDYCNNHPSLRLKPGELFDPIQVEPILPEDFAISDTRSLQHLNLTHNEPVENERYIFDSVRGEILSPARPNNVFWSKHLSNMMQQNYTLGEFFELQDELVARRHAMLNGRSELKSKD